MSGRTGQVVARKRLAAVTKGAAAAAGKAAAARAEAAKAAAAKAAVAAATKAAAVAAPEAAPLRPAQCRAYMRRTLATEFRGIVDGFVKGAKSGSCQHVKLATELLEPRPRAKKAQGGRRTLERWLDEIERGV